MFGWLALSLFLVCTTLFWLRLLTVSNATTRYIPGESLISISWAAAILFTGIFTAQRVISSAGYDLSFYNALLITGFIVALIALVSSILSRSQFLGVFVLPLGALCVALNLFFYHGAATPASQFSLGLELHILLSIMAFSLFGLSAVQAVLLYMQERQLKHHQSPRLFAALPSLHENEVSLHHFNVAGFTFLTLALFTGFVYLENIFAQHLAHKTILSIIAWGVFATLLTGRYRFGWRGITAVRWTLVGFIVLMLAYLGSKLVLEMILNRP